MRKRTAAKGTDVPAGNALARAVGTKDSAGRLLSVPAASAAALLTERAAWIAGEVPIPDRLAAIRVRVAAGEARFGMSPDAAHAAIEEGTLIESAEVCDWLLDHALMLRVAPATPTIPGTPPGTPPGTSPGPPPGTGPRDGA